MATMKKLFIIWGMRNIKIAFCALSIMTVVPFIMMSDGYDNNSFYKTVVYCFAAAYLLFIWWQIIANTIVRRAKIVFNYQKGTLFWYSTDYVNKVYKPAFVIEQNDKGIYVKIGDEIEFKNYDTLHAEVNVWKPPIIYK